MDTFFRELPKAELHVHLEGSLEPQTLCEIDSKLKPEEVTSRYRYRDFSGFIESFKWVLGYLRGPDEYALATQRLLERLHQQNVSYVEVTLSAGSILWQKLEFAPIYDAVTREAARSPVEVWWILDAIRHFGPQHARSVAELAAERVGDRVVAFGIGGDEQRGPAKEFGKVFRFAREHGLHVTAHAGETAGPESIWDAIDTGAERIGHGVTAAQDPELLGYLFENEIPLEVCLSSNAATGAVWTMKAHPLLLFLESGIPVVLNTDDPAMFHTSLTHEYELAESQFGLSRIDIERLAENSFRYAFQKRAD